MCRRAGSWHAVLRNTTWYNTTGYGIEWYTKREGKRQKPFFGKLKLTQAIGIQLEKQDCTAPSSKLPEGRLMSSRCHASVAMPLAFERLSRYAYTQRFAVQKNHPQDSYFIDDSFQQGTLISSIISTHVLLVAQLHWYLVNSQTLTTFVIHVVCDPCVLRICYLWTIILSFIPQINCHYTTCWRVFR